MENRDLCQTLCTCGSPQSIEHKSFHAPAEHSATHKERIHFKCSSTYPRPYEADKPVITEAIPDIDPHQHMPSSLNPCPKLRF